MVPRGERYPQGRKLGVGGVVVVRVARVGLLGVPGDAVGVEAVGPVRRAVAAQVGV